MIRKLQLPTIFIAAAWVILVVIVFSYGFQRGYIEGDWMTIIVWLVMPTLLIGIILSASSHNASCDDN
jgi:ABC-type multidrug transport system permease subunit